MSGTDDDMTSAFMSGIFEHTDLYKNIAPGCSGGQIDSDPCINPVCVCEACAAKWICNDSDRDQ